jgi:uncharacterized protein YoxC
MTQRREEHLRPETPTRALLRRVQRRSSAGVAPPPLPTKRYVTPKLDQVAEGSRSNAIPGTIQSQETNDESEEQEDMEALMHQIDRMHDDIDGKDARILELEAQLREASSSRGTTAASQGGLTRAAALKLEREFASQERILQGLQRDNEAKTIEVEKLRREKKTLADYLARQYGADDWEKIVFNSAYGNKAGGDGDAGTDNMTPSKFSMGVASPRSTVKALKGPLGRVGKTSEGLAESSFFSAVDESIVELPPPSSSSPVPATSPIDVASILSLIESQKMLIKGFERSNALKMVECQEKLRLAREKEQMWNIELALHQQQASHTA